MQNPRLASRYAKSLIGLAQELNQLEVVHTDMLFLQQVMKSNPDVVSLLKSPIIKADKKQKILAAIFEGRISATTISFINLLVTKGRESALAEMTTEFTRQYMVLKNISPVKITTAVALDNATLDVIKQKIASETTQQIQLEAAVNADLIGGFVLETNDQLFDASILRDLKDIKQQFNKNIYVSDLR
ncbi:ATP synthase F1 subunit delta [Chitinophaga ginsengisegetis]|uniref:ATP synthase F1 subunit delta n=1 Tax=Chitinophaga ginsengisegetis TaxID=393003 RepID=UPI000DB975BB|nr:ATP synthase F1 subunit delta [Chitinophaga ginsengisegetis]MDR6570265.1 F-type H+-transporting ATPase subunit delta [Chitinophaga ginsengisegetis]MDR6649999.1 F-type H+-transporting ATPase subunit delta [Chitinophaga ginsengisegetis]MDR6656360.1 F-type H+-transporting ATPase subunit delta [Chitinophaga ginsengisegetis]